MKREISIDLVMVKMNILQQHTFTHFFNLYQNTCFCSFDEWLKINKYEEREPLIDIYLDIVMEYERFKKRV